jgi:hypothetical protein
VDFSLKFKSINFVSQLLDDVFHHIELVWVHLILHNIGTCCPFQRLYWRFTFQFWWFRLNWLLSTLICVLSLRTWFWNFQTFWAICVESFLAIYLRNWFCSGHKRWYGLWKNFSLGAAKIDVSRLLLVVIVEHHLKVFFNVFFYFLFNLRL